MIKQGGFTGKEGWERKAEVHGYNCLNQQEALEGLCKDHAMITYRAMFKYLDEGVHGEVLDFP